MTRPTELIERGIRRLLKANQIAGEPAEMYLGKDIFIVRLRQPKIIDGHLEDIDSTTIDIFDLMDYFQKEHTA